MRTLGMWACDRPPGRLAGASGTHSSLSLVIGNARSLSLLLSLKENFPQLKALDHESGHETEVPGAGG